MRGLGVELPFTRSNSRINGHASRWFIDMLAVRRWWVIYKSDASYVSCRTGIYYYTWSVPFDVRQHYASNRLSFSPRTKSNAGAFRAAQSVTRPWGIMGWCCDRILQSSWWCKTSKNDNQLWKRWKFNSRPFWHPRSHKICPARYGCPSNRFWVGADSFWSWYWNWPWQKWAVMRHRG